MTLKDILAITGQPGLFKYVAQSANGIIVEALADGKRMNATGSAKLSSLAEIAVYTDEGEMPLHEILDMLYKKSEGKPAIDPKSPPEKLKAYFQEIVPDYDRERVHTSAMKKILSWYNILLEMGMTDFSVEEEEPAAEEEQ